LVLLLEVARSGSLINGAGLGQHSEDEEAAVSE
jgi:hypothetical protein